MFSLLPPPTKSNQTKIPPFSFPPPPHQTQPLFFFFLDSVSTSFPSVEVEEANKMEVGNVDEVASMQRGGKTEEKPKDEVLLQNNVSVSPQEWNLKEIRDTQFGINEMEDDINLGLSLGGIYTQQSKCQQQTPLPPLATSFLSPPSTIIPYNHTLPPHFTLPTTSVLLLPMQRELEEMKRTNNPVDSGMNNEKDPVKKLIAPEPVPSSPSDVTPRIAASVVNNSALSRAIFRIKTENEELKREAQGMLLERGGGSSKGPEKKRGKVVTWAPSVVHKSESAETETEQDPRSKRAKVSRSVTRNGYTDKGIDIMLQMPTVATVGDGPYGTRVEGFLNRYNSREVSIVCFCHGYFLGPQEFILHAGGSYVRYPMRHITVCTSPP